MKKRLTVLCMIGLLAILAGCGLLSERSYLYTQQHDDQYEEDVNTDALTVENYYGLRSAILSFVESGTEYGIIRSYSYDGDIEEDLDTAAYEVTRSDPVGAYAVDYMTHSCNRIVSYYEIEISITFRRTPEDIASIVRVSSVSEAEEEIVAALENYQSSLTLRMSYTSELDVQGIVEEASRADTMIAIGSPEVTMQIYPETGVQRIVELTFTYDQSEAVLTLKKEQAIQVLEEISRFVSTEVSDESRMTVFFRRLCNRCTYAADGDLGNVYDALVTCSSGSKGIAEAFYELCTRNDLTCITVSGQKNGETHWWNIVTLDGQSYHVDLTAAMEEGKTTMTLWYDEDIFSAYSWDTALYPACTRPVDETEEDLEEIAPEEISDPDASPEETQLPDGEEPESSAEPSAQPETGDGQADEGAEDLTEEPAEETQESTPEETAEENGG